MQFHSFLPHLCCTLYDIFFQAQMKLDRRINSECRKKLVYNLLMDVGLIGSANNFIGTAMYGQATVRMNEFFSICSPWCLVIWIIEIPLDTYAN